MTTQQCNTCSLTVDSETIVCCASCGFDTCPDCMNDNMCDDCTEDDEDGDD